MNSAELRRTRLNSAELGRNRPNSADFGRIRPILADFQRVRPISSDVGRFGPRNGQKIFFNHKDFLIDGWGYTFLLNHASLVLLILDRPGLSYVLIRVLHLVSIVTTSQVL